MERSYSKTDLELELTFQIICKTFSVSNQNDFRVGQGKLSIEKEISHFWSSPSSIPKILQAKSIFRVLDDALGEIVAECFIQESHKAIIRTLYDAWGGQW